MKFCNKCELWKNEEEFAKRTFKNRIGLQSWCKKCNNSNRIFRYQNNRVDEVKVRRERRHNQRKFIDEIKGTMICKKCGNSNPIVLDFHHRNSEEKDFTIADATQFSKKHILEEIEKCDILCANCHRIAHYQ